MRRMATKCVPQQELRLDATMERAGGDPDFLKAAIAGDESWEHGYDPETKAGLSVRSHKGSTSQEPRVGAQKEKASYFPPTLWSDTSWTDWAFVILVFAISCVKN